MLNRELPPIGRRCAEIIEGPYLIGVTELSTAGREAITLSIGAMIREKDSYKVKLFLNRETQKPPPGFYIREAVLKYCYPVPIIFRPEPIRRVAAARLISLSFSAP